MVRSPSIRRQARAPPGRPPSMPESLEKPVTFPRRFPRLGSQFQTRIKKIPTPLERPPPSIMSEEYPHIIQGEESSMQIDVNGELYFCFLQVLYGGMFRTLEVSKHPCDRVQNWAIMGGNVNIGLIHSVHLIEYPQQRPSRDNHVNLGGFRPVSDRKRVDCLLVVGSLRQGPRTMKVRDSGRSFTSFPVALPSYVLLVVLTCVVYPCLVHVPRFSPSGQNPMMRWVLVVKVMSLPPNEEVCCCTHPRSTLSPF
jgi:hypothetical protein